VRAARLLMVAGALLPGMPGAVAEVGDDPVDEELEVVRVIGTHIPQLDEAGLAPVLVLDREDIERTGSIFLSEVLQQLPIDNAGTFNDRDPLAAALGGSGISLRGLGASSVLILVNDRRAATYGFPQRPGDGSLVSFVDLNNVPVAAVERVEILSDTASAIYGSEAIAGVVNIVLRDRFSGVQLQARAGEADENGAEERAVNGIFGWVGDTGNIELIASYSKRDPVAWKDRHISASANHEADGGADQRDLAGTNFLIDVGLGSFGADCKARNASAFEALPEGVCLYNPNQAIVQPNVERSGATVIANHLVGTTVNAHVELSYLNGSLKGSVEPVELNGATFPSASPWNPFDQDALSYYQFTETGPRVNDVDTDNYRAVSTFEGRLGPWDWEVGGLYSRADVSNHSQGQVSADSVQAALNGVDVNGDGILQVDEYLNLFSPVSNPNSAALIDSLRVSSYRKSRSELASVFANAVSSPFVLPAGALRVALGADHTYESLDDRSDPLSVGSQLAALEPPERYFGMRVDEPFDQIDPYAYIGVWDLPDFQTIAPSGAPLANGDRARNGVYAEALVPVTRRLEIQAAVRYDAIQGLDSEVSPRVAVRFEPFGGHALRASWGRGFRAPSLAELYVGPSSRVQASWDPELCPEPGFLLPIAGGCLVKSFLTIQQGNDDLKSETSESWSIGVTSRPFEAVSGAVDCWRVEIDDRIIALGPERILRYEQALQESFVVRRPPEPWQAAVGISGFVDLINDRYTNAASQKVSGCDVEIDTHVDSEALGQLGAQFVATHMASNKFQAAPGAKSEQLAGTFGFPENRANLNLFWQRRSWGGSVRGRYISSFDHVSGVGNVDSHLEWDAQLSFSGLRGYEFTLGIENLLDEEPPSAFGLQGFPQQYYDMRGRFLYVQARITFPGRGAPAP
jgi:iron complex outermembrane recepter protein